jgi:hypothetical protein
MAACHVIAIFALAKDRRQSYIPQRLNETGFNPAYNRVSSPMDEIVRGNRTRGSVWGVAAIAVAVFIAVVLVIGMFG